MSNTKRFSGVPCQVDSIICSAFLYNHLGNQSRNWDYLIAANKYSEQIFESAFMYPKENILTYGYPRNDILHNYTSEYKH